MYYKKPKKRQREIPFEELELFKETMGFNWKECAELLGISQTQICMYRKSGNLPATRYYAARDAVLVSIEEESREKRDKIMKLFSSTTT